MILFHHFPSIGILLVNGFMKRKKNRDPKGPLKLPYLCSDGEELSCIFTFSTPELKTEEGYCADKYPW